MATTVTLQDLLEATDDEYGSFIVRVNDIDCEFRSMLQLPRADRKALSEITSEDDEELDQDEDRDEILEVFHGWAKIVLVNDEQFEAVSNALGDNIARWKVLQDQWSKATNPGEASPSES